MNGFLLDTNVISELIKPRPDSRVTRRIDATDEATLFLSALTPGEIRKGIAALASSARRATLEGWLESALRPRFAGRILTIDEAIADRRGLLAATALHHNLTLVTRNAKDVAPTGVAVLNPWEE